MTRTEIAKAIAPASLVLGQNRVAHWTKLGLLSVDGKRFPGTGNRRSYSGDSVAKAKVLNAMTDMGVPARLMGGILNEFVVIDLGGVRALRFLFAEGAGQILVKAPAEWSAT